MKKVKILFVLVGVLIASIIFGEIMWKVTKDNSMIGEIAKVDMYDEKNTIDDKNVEDEKTEENNNISIEESEDTIIEENQVNVERKEMTDDQLIQTNILEDKSYAVSSPSAVVETSSQITTSSPIETTIIEQATNENNNIEIKTEETEQKVLTPSDFEYWCLQGGSHHLLGDGPNEHGYYNTWDEAYNAFKDYTSEWGSGNFKVDQCACGLYYFWAKQ